MARKPYGPFSVDDRNASAWLFKQGVRAGRYSYPDKKAGCRACKLRSGPLESHREDYSVLDPTDLIVLCFRCHRMVHLRDKFPESWVAYCEAIRQGWRFSIASDIGKVMAQNIYCRDHSGAHRVNPVRERTVLDQIGDNEFLRDPPEVIRKRMDALRSEREALRPARKAPSEAPTLPLT